MGCQTTMHVTCLLLATLLAVTSAQPASSPSGCTYTSDGVYECDFGVSSSLNYASFELDYPPQRLYVYNINGQISSSSFTNFNQYNESRYDSNYDATLELVCEAPSGTLTIATSAFTDMDFYKNFQITNCDIQNLVTRSFRNFNELNYFGIHGGQVQTVSSNALGSFKVRIDSTSVDPRGELSIVNVDFVGGNPFINQFLDEQTAVTKLTLQNCDMDEVPVGLITLMSNITTLDLSNNPFTELTTGMFTGVHGITSLVVANVPWQCSCSSLWWLTYVTENGMSIDSEVICASPSTYSGQRAQSYFTEVCTGGLQCDGGKLPALNLGGVTCLTYLQLGIYVMAIVAFVGVALALACHVHTKRQLQRMEEGGPAQRKAGGGGGNRVANRGANRGRQPPPPPGGMGRMGGWA